MCFHKIVFTSLIILSSQQLPGNLQNYTLHISKSTKSVRLHGCDQPVQYVPGFVALHCHKIWVRFKIFARQPHVLFARVARDMQIVWQIEWKEQLTFKQGSSQIIKQCLKAPAPTFAALESGAAKICLKLGKSSLTITLHSKVRVLKFLQFIELCRVEEFKGYSSLK